MAKHIAGKKISKHSSVIEPALPIVRKLMRRDEVTKISLGMIKQVRNAKQSIRTKDLSGGLQLVVRGTCSIQKISVYSKDLELTKQFLAKYES
tara:strand:+ start:684 stop:962 length:279 start_codon:yes stop_codon:yes gene_type:complete